jgi:hypothetical protein
VAFIVIQSLIDPGEASQKKPEGSIPAFDAVSGGRTSIREQPTPKRPETRFLTPLVE